jgi:hypothetical protein
MNDRSRILLVDDGELGEVASLLDRLHIEYVRLRGGDIADELPPPTHLLVATPRRAQAVVRGAASGAPPGQPLRIISVDEDSNAMRRMLRRMGFHLLVRKGAHPEVWRLLIERALFQGDERRTEPRVPVGAPISLAAFRASRSEDTRTPALLVDISNRGCRLGTNEPLEPGSRLSLAIRLDDQGGDVLNLRGRLVRTSSTPAGGLQAHGAAMLFDADLSEADRRLLTRLLNDLSVGPGTLTYGPAEALPPCESPVIPGLTLDAETDPAFHAGVRVELEPRATASQASAEPIDPDRRRGPRVNFASRITATSDEGDPPRSRVLMGRDLSGGGMRVERTDDVRLGERYQLAIYAPIQQHPFLVEARVVRDDGDEGLALRFVDVSPERARELEKIVACLPDVESLEESEAGGLGAVISEIISRSED